jgi:hypothetical protein
MIGQPLFLRAPKGAPTFTRYDHFAIRMTAAPGAHVSAFVFLVMVCETHMCVGMSRGWLQALCWLMHQIRNHEKTRKRTKKTL